MSRVQITYFRHHSEYRDDADSVEEAIAFLAYGEANGHLTSAGARIQDGDRVIEGDELKNLVTAVNA